MTKTYEELYDEEGLKQAARMGVTVPAKEDLTCYRCPDVNECELAWDLYNTDGDCLASK